MVRSYWMGAAVLGLAVTGLARGQRPPQAGGPALVAPGETTVTVQEPGKPGDVCKILKSWQKRDGAWAHQVQSLKTGEMMTIEEAAPANGPPGSRLRATARHVFHWGRSPVPPQGAPLPPDVQAPAARPPAAVAPPQQAQPASAARPSGVRPVGVLTEAGPAGTPTVWPSAYASRPASPGRAPIPMPSAGSEVVNPYATPRVSAAPLVPPAESHPAPAQPTLGAQPAAPGTNSTVVVTEAAPPRRRLLSRLFGRDKEGDGAEEIFSAPAAPVVSPPHPAVVQAPAVAPAPRMTPVPTPAPMAAPPVVKSTNTQPDYTRRDRVATPPPAPAATAARTAPAAAPAPPAVTRAPAPAPVVKSAPAPVIVGATAKPLAGEPVILNKGVSGEPVIVSEPRRPLLSRVLKASDEKVTTVATSTPVVVTPDKGKAAEAAKAPAVVSGPVSSNAPLPGAKAGNTQPDYARHPSNVAGAPAAATGTVATAAPAKPGDWRESWGNATPKAETVAPRPTTWSQPGPRADRIVMPKADPLTDPASYSRLARQDVARKPVETTSAPRSEVVSPTIAMPRPEVSSSATVMPRPEATAPTARTGPQGVQVAAGEGNAFSAPQPVAPRPQPPAASNAFVSAPAAQPAPQAPAGYLPPALPTPPAAMGRPYYPPAPTYVTGGTPTGLANAFTPTGNARPIPADFGPVEFAANGFSDPSQPVAVARAGGPVPPPMPGYFPPMAPRGGYAPAPTGRPIAQAAPAVSPPQLLGTLRDSLLPSQREWAADQLAGVDWRANPQAVDALVTAAHSDPAASVRAGCVRALAKMKANTPPVVAAVEGLMRDADPRVRNEAQEALSTLAGGPPRNDGGVRPASAGGLR